MRSDGRKLDQLRKVTIRKGYLKNALGSCLIEMGETKVLCSASLEDRVPPFLKGKGKGWLTAEYGMLPGSCTERVSRETGRGGPSGRTYEIQRLIGRSLRAVVDLGKIGERSFWVDADVIQGDGGTRTAAITGGFIALADAISSAIKDDRLAASPILDYIAAISVGVVHSKPVVDLCYTEDMSAEVDMNVVMTGSCKFVEVQGTAENNPFSKKDLDKMLILAKKGIQELIAIQQKYVRI